MARASGTSTHIPNPQEKPTRILRAAALRPSDATESHHEHVNSRSARPGQQSKPRRGVSVIHPRVTASRFAESSNRSAMASSPGDDTRLRCAVLVGAVGAGKSSIGNALCQKPSEPPPFRSRRSASGVTTACACAPCLAPGLGGAVVSSASERWWVVDTPGLRDGDDARAPEHLLRAIEACACWRLQSDGRRGRVSVGVQRDRSGLFGRPRGHRDAEAAIRRGAVPRTRGAVFTHADVLIADGGGADEKDESEIAASYLRTRRRRWRRCCAPRGRARVRGRRARAVSQTRRWGQKNGPPKQAVVGSRRRSPTAVRRVDRVAPAALAAAIGVGRPARNARVVAADVAAAAEARLPRLGMKAARRRGRKVRKREDGLGLKKTPVDWVGDAFAWFSSVVAPPPSPGTGADRTETGDDRVVG